MKTARTASFALAAAVVAVACRETPAQKPEPKAVTPTGEMKPLSPEDRPLAEQAVEILARELDVPPETIQVDSVRAVEWRDSSMGCPRPDEAAYLQVITPGHRVTLRVDGALYFVHEANGHAFVCRQKKTATGPGERIELVWGEAALKARADLAERLGVAPSTIQVASARAQTWPDAALGCPEDGKTYEEEPTDGWVITLRHEQRRVTYHTDLDRVVACPPITTD